MKTLQTVCLLLTLLAGIETSALAQQEAIRDGHAETCRKYNLSLSLLCRWRLKYLSKGKEGLKDSYARVDPQLRTLGEENERLKRIVAKQALEIEIKSELLKKTPVQPRRN